MADNLISSLRERLAKFNNLFEVDLCSIEQRSWHWHKMRLGVITASSISGVLAKTGIVNQIPFVYRDETMRCGCSPDGVTEKKTIECKAPWNTRYHIEAIVDGRIKKEYQEQVQFQMWVCGTESVDFVSFDPRMLKHNFFMTTVERSDTFMKKFDDAIPQFIMEMDAKLERLGFRFGEQFKA